MANQPDTHEFAPVYQLETTDEVLGGAGGVANAPHLAVASRTLWLRRELLALQLSNWNSAPFDLSPTWTHETLLEDGCAITNVPNVTMHVVCGSLINAGLFAGPLVAYSLDGIAWKACAIDTSLAGGRLFGVDAQGATIVACGTASGGKWQVQRSLDNGDTWTLEQSNIGDAANDIALAPSGVWAIAQENGLISAIPAVGEAPNDIYPGVGSDTRPWLAIAYAASKFVAVGAGRIASFPEAGITDGSLIDCYLLPSGNTLDGIVYGDGTWFATGSTTAYAYSSTDLVTWTETFIGHGLRSPVYVPQLSAFVALHDDGKHLAILTRGNGEETWAKRLVPTLEFSNADTYPPDLRVLTRSPHTSALVAVGRTTLRSLQLGAV